MDIKILDKDLVQSSLNLTYPIFTGLKREALVAQAEKGIQIAEQGQRKTTLELSGMSKNTITALNLRFRWSRWLMIPWSASRHWKI
jgi:hypothetical protein